MIMGFSQQKVGYDEMPVENTDGHVGASSQLAGVSFPAPSKLCVAFLTVIASGTVADK